MWQSLGENSNDAIITGGWKMPNCRNRLPSQVQRQELDDLRAEHAALVAKRDAADLQRQVRL